MKRYEIRWTALDPTRGAEMSKTRPAVIVSLDALNRALPTVTVCPLTSQLHPTWRSRLQVRCGGRRAEVAVACVSSEGRHANQILTRVMTEVERANDLIVVGYEMELR